MPTAVPAQPAGRALRDWRERRRLTQLDLSHQAGVSARHLSCVETGRSTPTAAMIIRLADSLDIPLRDRNAILVSAGFAPIYSQNDLGDPPLSMISGAINMILDAHAPYPAVVVDRRWEMVSANPGVDILTAGASAALLEPPINVLRLTLHPDGLAPRILNLAEWSGHILSRLEHEYTRTGDTHHDELLRELRTYAPPVAATRSAHADRAGDSTAHPPLVVPLTLQVNGAVLSMFSMTSVFGTPTDVTVSELAIEAFFPLDRATRAFFEGAEA